MLKKEEEDAQFQVLVTKKAAEKDRTDENLQNYYAAVQFMEEGKKMVKD
jgi:hypothetical protein